MTPVLALLLVHAHDVPSFAILVNHLRIRCNWCGPAIQPLNRSRFAAVCLEQNMKECLRDADSLADGTLGTFELKLLFDPFDPFDSCLSRVFLVSLFLSFSCL